MSICIVDDGAYRWGADWNELQAAMLRLGWTQSGAGWTEPATYQAPDDTAHYAGLCDLVRPAAGYAPADFPLDAAGCHRLTWSPADDCWRFEAAPAR